MTCRYPQGGGGWGTPSPPSEVALFAPLRRLYAPGISRAVSRTIYRSRRVYARSQKLPVLDVRSGIPRLSSLLPVLVSRRHRLAGCASAADRYKRSGRVFVFAPRFDLRSRMLDLLDRQVFRPWLGSGCKWRQRCSWLSLSLR